MKSDKNLKAEMIQVVFICLLAHFFASNKLFG